MVAITQARDPEVIRLLVDASPSTTEKNEKGETAQVLAGQLSNPAMVSLAEPPCPNRVSCHVLVRQAELTKRSCSSSAKLELKKGRRISWAD